MSIASAGFIKMYTAAAQACQAKTGIPASFTLAQGGLESSWGTSGLAIKAGNLFGVKADASWKGPIYELPTREFLNGEWVMVVAKWRRYLHPLDCLADHATFFQVNPRYAKCFIETTGEGWANAVAAAGYATDPDYAKKLVSIIQSNNLAILDVLPSQLMTKNVPPTPQDPELPPQA